MLQFRVQTPFMKFFAANIFILNQLQFYANKVKFNAFLKIQIFQTPRFYYGKTPHHMLFSAGSLQLLHISK